MKKRSNHHCHRCEEEIESPLPSVLSSAAIIVYSNVEHRVTSAVAQQMSSSGAQEAANVRARALQRSSAVGIERASSDRAPRNFHRQICASRAPAPAGLLLCCGHASIASSGAHCQCRCPASATAAQWAWRSRHRSRTQTYACELALCGHLRSFTLLNLSDPPASPPGQRQTSGVSVLCYVRRRSKAY